MTRILFAEDEPDIRELVEMTLIYGGYEPTAACDGQEALELAQAGSYDLVLLDVRMPRLSGYDACRAIKELPAYQDVPVVFVSAKGQEAEVEMGIVSGAAAYILKPFSPDDLLRAIGRVLAEQSGG